MTEFKQGDKVVVTDCVVEDVFNKVVIVRTPDEWRKILRKEFVKLQEQAKPKVPQVMMDYYETYRDKGLLFSQWFGDMSELDTYFSRIDEVAEWLYGNDKKTNAQRELALATLIVNGPDAVEVEEEKRYRVKFKTLGTSGYYLSRNGFTGYEFNNSGNIVRTFTKQELINAGFGGVFDNEMFEVEEV